MTLIENYISSIHKTVAEDWFLSVMVYLLNRVPIGFLLIKYKCLPSFVLLELKIFLSLFF